MSAASRLLYQINILSAMSGANTPVSLSLSDAKEIVLYYSRKIDALEAENKKWEDAFNHLQAVNAGHCEELDWLENENEEPRKAVNKLREDDR